jgi:hypothetical protein
LYGQSDDFSVSFFIQKFNGIIGINTWYIYIPRASFSISVFFLVRTILSKLCGTKKFKQALMILFVVELPVYLGILIGSFFIPSCK